MKSYLLRLMMVALMAPASVLAAPLQAVLVGDYRPLRAAEAEQISEGFEAQLLARLGTVLDSEMTLVGAKGQADLRAGALESGVAYYRSEVAALTSSEGGPFEWSDLAGETFCVTIGSPHASVVTARFGGIARSYPSAAQALIGLKLGECQAVVDDRLLLDKIARLPEWRRYDRLLPALPDSELALRIEAGDAALQRRVEQAVSGWLEDGQLADLTQHWVDEVAFQAYVLADTLDCH
ncbi:amino acid ABC transporter substrate-binding protein [Stutzerimonas sp. VN223-3]|uniref:amino acid ABC transporter substrate-binding protein n=1 Tax=Stutzerimonas sp. VN223-3 TaxID=3384601 RepID=UPI0038B647AB